MYVVIFTGGILRDGEFVSKALEQAELVIGADSGAGKALEFGVVPQVAIGDFDALSEENRQTLEEKGCEFIAYDSEKDETDTELAIAYALEQGASDITILGGIEGDRIDHILGNIFLLTGIAIPIRFVNSSTVVWCAQGPQTVDVIGKPKDLLSLIPLTAEVTDVTTKDLRYSLDRATMAMSKPLGISNVLTKYQATITFTQGTLLFVHTRETS